jgi:hypothetical protein
MSRNLPVVRKDTEGTDTMADVHMMDPLFQNMPESLAILNLLRKLSLKWSDFAHELTEPEWTAFKTLARKGAVEGILRFTLVCEDPARTVVEYHHIRGDYATVEDGDPIPAGTAVDLHLTRARLTGRGKRWADYLAAESRQDPVGVRGAVLSLVLDASVVPGSATKVPLLARLAPPPENLAVAPVADAPPSSRGPTTEPPASAPPTHSAVPAAGDAPVIEADAKKRRRGVWPVERTEAEVQEYLRAHKKAYRKLGRACLGGKRGATDKYWAVFGVSAIARSINEKYGLTGPGVECRKQNVSDTDTYQTLIRPLGGTPAKRPDGWAPPEDKDDSYGKIVEDIQGTEDADDV